MPKAHHSSPSRLLELDYLRGFFIIVIIVDHLNRWPSILEVFTGRDALWVSAAEGFVMISGLLLGYIRGFKSRDTPMKSVALTVLKRAIILYIWAVICTILLVALTWYGNFNGPLAYVPIIQGEWGVLTAQAFTLEYTHPLIHFLYLYTVFLLVAPAALYLLRRKLWWVVMLISITAWVLGSFLQLEFMQWQILFFLPAIAGFYMDSIRTKIGSLSQKVRTSVSLSLIVITLATIIISAFNLLPAIHDIFGRAPLGYGRIILAAIWFMAFLVVFSKILPWLTKYLSWVLKPFGTSSLTAYILHIIPLMLCSILFVVSDNIWINTLLGVACIVATLGLMKIPLIAKIVPR